MNLLINEKGNFLIFNATALALFLYFIAIIGTMFLSAKQLPLIIIGFPALIFFVYLLVNQTHYLLLFYVMLIPLLQHFNFIGFGIGDFFITIHMAFQFVILLGVAYHYINNHSGKDGALSTLEKTFGIFFILTFFSLIFPFYLPMQHTKRFLLFYNGIIEPIMFYFMLTFYLRRKNTFERKLFWAIILSSFATLIVSYFELAPTGMSIVKIYLSRVQIGFGYHNTNLFGIHFSLLFPILFYFVIDKDFTRHRYIVIASFVILTVLSILTFNRGTFIVLGLQIFLLLFMIKEGRKVILFMLFALLIITIYYNEIIFFYIFRFIGGESSGGSKGILDASVYYRMAAWEVGLKMLFLFPLGLGAGGFQYAWEKYGVDPTFYLGTPHQLFLSIGVDYGLLVLITFIVILTIVFVDLSQLIKKPLYNSTNFYKCMVISFIGFIVYGMLTDGELSHLTGFTLPNNGYTLILFSLFAIISYNKEKLNER